jgi:hypothetical protein
MSKARKVTTCRVSAINDQALFAVRFIGTIVASLSYGTAPIPI